MNKYLKILLAIILFLLIGGYVAVDYYAQYKVIKAAQQKQLVELKIEKPCFILETRCQLSSDTLSVQLSDTMGSTELFTNTTVDTVVLSILDKRNKEDMYKMVALDKEQKHWQVYSAISEALHKDPTVNLRLVIKINNQYYFSKFDAVATTIRQP